MARTNKKEGEKKLCYCEKGVFPKRDLRAEFRCPECGRLIWPAVMGSESEQNR